MINRFIFRLIAWSFVWNIKFKTITKIVVLVVIILTIKYINKMYLGMYLFDTSLAETEDTNQNKPSDVGIVKWWQLAIVLSLISGVLFVVVYQVIMLINGIDDMSKFLVERISEETSKTLTQMENFKHGSFIKTENIIKRVTENLSDTMAQNISEKITQNVYEDINDLTNRVSNLENKFDAIVELAKRLKK